jgi:hypothetical protein
MNLFQLLSLTVLGSLFLTEVYFFWRGKGARRLRFFRATVWVSAAVAVAFPNLVQEVATAIGIGRGADVVLYVFVLGFMWIAFYLYSRCLRLEQQVTQLIRHLALQEAQHGPIQASTGDRPSTQKEENS